MCDQVISFLANRLLQLVCVMLAVWLSINKMSINVLSINAKLVDAKRINAMSISTASHYYDDGVDLKSRNTDAVWKQITAA